MTQAQRTAPNLLSPRLTNPAEHGPAHTGTETLTFPPPSCFQRRFESAHKLDELDTDRVADLLQLEQVQPPRPGLVLAYEGLRAAQRIGNICLVKAFFLSSCTEQ